MCRHEKERPKRGEDLKISVPTQQIEIDKRDALREKVCRHKREREREREKEEKTSQ